MGLENGFSQKGRLKNTKEPSPYYDRLREISSQTGFDLSLLKTVFCRITNEPDDPRKLEQFFMAAKAYREHTPGVQFTGDNISSDGLFVSPEYLEEVRKQKDLSAKKNPTRSVPHDRRF